jgi:hypothetical protein
MKKVILAVAVALLFSTSAVASDFCEVPKWLKEDKSYIMVLGNGQKASGTVIDVDKNSCWIIVEDRSQNVRMDIDGPGMHVNVNIRQIVSALEQK